MKERLSKPFSAQPPHAFQTVRCGNPTRGLLGFPLETAYGVGSTIASYRAVSQFIRHEVALGASHPAVEQLRIVDSGCIGYVIKNSDGVTPEPRWKIPGFRHRAPGGFAVRDPLHRPRVRWPYPTEGFVYLAHDDKGVSGATIFELDLPESKGALAR